LIILLKVLRRLLTGADFQYQLFWPSRPQQSLKNKRQFSACVQRDKTDLAAVGPNSLRRAAMKSRLSITAAVRCR